MRHANSQQMYDHCNTEDAGPQLPAVKGWMYVYADLSNQPARSFSKKAQTKHNRLKPGRKERGAITQEVFDEVELRSEGNCEWCGNPNPKIAWGLEKAHLEGRGQLGRGDIPWNIANLCGPYVNKGTCHWKVDSRTEGMLWAAQYRQELMVRYDVGICTVCNKEEAARRGDDQHICVFCAKVGY